AEGGIRCLNVSGVQTCALPIWSVVSVMGSPLFQYASRSRRDTRHGPPATRHREGTGEPEDRRYRPRRPSHTDTKNRPSIRSVARSEERRVGEKYKRRGLPRTTR